jgi:hypothetical protein
MIDQDLNEYPREINQDLKEIRDTLLRTLKIYTEMDKKIENINNIVRNNKK